MRIKVKLQFRGQLRHAFTILAGPYCERKESRFLQLCKKERFHLT